MFMAGVLRSAKAYATAFGNWRSVLGYLMVQDVGQRFKSSRLAAIMAICEPILLIVLLVAFRGIFRGRVAEFGTSIWVFYSSGVFPFYVFQRVSARTRAKYAAFNRLPRVSSTNLLIASATAEAEIILTSMMIWFTILWLCGEREAVPTSIGACLIALMLLALLGGGVGLINSAISERYYVWTFVYGRTSRFLLFLSGVYYIIDLLPYHIRAVVVWNPIGHGIELFRLGLYGQYPVLTHDLGYFIGCTAAALFIGVIAHQGTLRYSK